MPSDRSGYSSDAFGSTYAHFQWSKALTTAEGDPDPEVRARAEARIARWTQVIEHALRGTADYGSRTPFAHVPAWATLEVATGGFATGRLLAGSELTGYERSLAASLADVRADQERLDLNLWHLSDAGIDHLQQLLGNGHFRVDLPEEAALPMVAWLLGHGRAEEARSLIETIAPFFDRLRFFPERTDDAPSASAEVSIFTVGDVQRRLSELSGQPRLAEQKRAVETRLPLYDEAIALFLDTYVDGWPCRHYPEGWREAAQALCARIDSARRDLQRDRNAAKDRAEELFVLLAACASESATLTGRHVGRIRRVVDDFVEAHGRPGSPQHRAFRERQQRDVAAPAHERIGKVIAARLAAYPVSEGIADFTALSIPITNQEATAFSIQSGSPLPRAITHRLERCRRGTIAELIGCGIISSGDTIARVLPALSAEIRSAELADPALRRLYAATYRAFRRRRSLLLLNLQSQVRLTELPWIAAVDADRRSDAATVDSARTALNESASVVIESFPYAIVPNKLVKEFRALANSAQLGLPFVEEIAADIFMGKFTETYLDAARRAARVVAGTIYADYYNIDTALLASLPDKPKWSDALTSWSGGSRSGDALSKLAAERADVSLGAWSPAVNGSILEQSQILTTHNLALLFEELDLRTSLDPKLDKIALRCFEWICKRQQMRITHWHARLIMVKNTAYAWRQMIFYLSMLDETRRKAAIENIETHFNGQTVEFKNRFFPAILGLRLAAEGKRLSQRVADERGARVFVGWTTGRHWLLS